MTHTIYIDMASARLVSGPEAEKGRSPRSPRSVPRGLGVGLSNEQKARICILARTAFDHLGIDGDFETWRHDEQEKAVGKHSLTACAQPDYNPLVAHFAGLAGETGVEMKAHMRGGTDDRRLAMHKLREACGERGLQLSYPAAICRRQFKCMLEEAGAKQIWNLVYTVRNRRKNSTTKSAKQNDNEPF